MSDMPTPEPVLDAPLDIQHDPFPAHEEGESRRIPHFGHVLLLLAIVGGSLLLAALLVGVFLHSRAALAENPVLAVATEASTSLLALGISWKVFPLLWKKPFLVGIEWNALAMRRNLPRLISAGVLLSFMAQLSQRFVEAPTNPEVDRLMRTPAGAWSVMALGVLLAPAFEEIVFRGFLLPALATAYDWLSLERTPAGLARWSTTTGHTLPARVFAAIISSICFALLHAPQNHYAWGVVGVLFGVGMVLAFIRLRLHSVASSTAVHITYNLTIFVLALIATGGFRHLDRLHS